MSADRIEVADPVSAQHHIGGRRVGSALRSGAHRSAAAHLPIADGSVG